MPKLKEHVNIYVRGFSAKYPKNDEWDTQNNCTDVNVKHRLISFRLVTWGELKWQKELP